MSHNGFKPSSDFFDFSSQRPERLLTPFQLLDNQAELFGDPGYFRPLLPTHNHHRGPIQNQRLRPFRQNGLAAPIDMLEGRRHGACSCGLCPHRSGRARKNRAPALRFAALSFHLSGWEVKRDWFQPLIGRGLSWKETRWPVTP